MVPFWYYHICYTPPIHLTQHTTLRTIHTHSSTHTYVSPSSHTQHIQHAYVCITLIPHTAHSTHIRMYHPHPTHSIFNTHTYVSPSSHTQHIPHTYVSPSSHTQHIPHNPHPTHIPPHISTSSHTHPSSPIRTHTIPSLHTYTHSTQCTAYEDLLPCSPEGSANVRYCETSMKDCFGLSYLHKFFSIPFLQMQVW